MTRTERSRKRTAKTRSSRLADVLPSSCHRRVVFSRVFDILRLPTCSSSALTRRDLRHPDLPATTTIAITLVAVASLAWHGRVPGIERRLTGALVQGPGSMAFEVGDVVSVLGSRGLVTVVALVLAANVWRRSGDAMLAATVPVAAAIGGIAELVAKHVVERFRPPTAVYTGEVGFGFPSGQTTGFVAVAISALAVLSARPTISRRAVGFAVVGALAAAVGLGRILVGADYVLDVGAGMLLGVLCARAAIVLVVLIDQVVANRRKSRATPSGPA